MCADIMAFVAGVALQSSTAIMPGYRRLRVREEHYPGVIADADATVAGLIYHHLSTDCWSRLDAFEGKMYERKTVTVLLANGTQAQVYCYVFRPEFHHRLTTEAWDYAAFLQAGKQEFQSRYCGFRAIDAPLAGQAGSTSPIKIADTPQTF